MEIRTSGTTIFVLCGLLGAALAGPISWDDSKCSTSCSSESHKFKYEPGKTYVYSYISQTKMGLTEDGTDELRHGSLAEIRAKAEVHVKGPCEMVLKLSDVSLSGTNKDLSLKTKRDLEAQPLPFSFDDGDIRDLCPAPEDKNKPFVLNTKRAIISVFKNTMSSLKAKHEVIREVDIAGDCITHYSAAEGWGSLTIKKSKDLNSCRQRQSGPASIFGKPYIVQESTIENAPLLSGKLECQQVVSSAGILQNAECKERNVFSPLSQSGKGAVVQTEARIVFKEQKDGAISLTGKMGRRTTLLFSSGKAEGQEPSGDGSQVRQLLQKLCPTGKVAVQLKSPELVAKLVAHLRDVNYDVLTRIYDELEHKQLCSSEVARDIFVDALGMAGTEAPVKLMVKLFKEDKLSRVRQMAWLAAMDFNSHVDEGVIRAILPLLKDYDLGGRQALLSLSSMVYGFCAEYSKKDSEGDCEDLPVMKELIAVLQKLLGDKCRTGDRQEEQRIRETLAAFENIGRAGDAEGTLLECLSTKENSLEVRHAAISAFRRTPCEEKVTRKLEEIFKDPSEDSAIRIYAYIGAMSCPDPQLVKTVEDTLKREEVQQVGAYVMSHLRNSKETSSPVKQDLQRLLNDVELNQKFPSDPRKYSQYFETSLFSSKLNAGAGFEGHLVRNEKSFVPKYMAFNMTTFAMGHELNLLELGVEMDGLTYWLEKWFGEDGYLNDVSMDKVLKSLGIKKDSESENTIDDEDAEKTRNTRDIKSGPLARINLLHERMGMTTPNDPKVSAHLYLLGRKFLMGYESDVQKLFEVREAFSIMEILTELAQKQKVERSFSFPLVDMEMTVPCYSGMELKMAVNATVMLGLIADGKFDIRSLFSSEKSVFIEGQFSPSSAVHVDAHLALNSGAQQSAIKISASGHTSHYLEGKIDIKRGRIFNFQVNMPKDKVELLSFKSEMLVVDADGEEKPVTPTAFHSLDGCTEVLERPLGIDICYTAKAPKPLYDKNAPLLPVSGPVQFGLTLKKVDKSLRSYTLQIQLPDEHEYSQVKYKAEFYTPGSSVDRHVLLEATLNRQSEEKTLNYKLESPFKQFDGVASLLGRPDQKQARLSLTIDKKDTYSVQGELKTVMSSGSTEFQPSLEFHPPRGDPYTFKGSVAYTAGKKDQLVIDLNSNRPLNNPSYLRGTIVKEGEFNTRNLDGRLKLSTDIILFLPPLIEARIHGTGDKQNTVYSSDLAVSYKLPGKSQHNAKFIAKMQNLSTNHLSKFSTKMEATFSQLPEANALLSWDYQHKPKAHLENDFKISAGTHYTDEEGVLVHILQVSKIQGLEQGGRKGETENRLLLTLPILENDLDLNMKTSWNVAGEGNDMKPSFNMNVDLKYQQDKHVQAALNYNYISSKPVEMEIEAKFSSPKHEFLYQDRVKERSPNEYEGKTMIHWARDKKANIEYVYRIKTDSSKVHHEVDLQLNTPLSRLPLQHKALFRITRNSIDVRSHTKYEGRPVYYIDAKLARDGLSKIQVSASDVEGELEFHNDPQAKSAKIEIKNKDNTWNYGGSTEYKCDKTQTSVSMEAVWNEKQDPSNKIRLIASATKPNPRRSVLIRGDFKKDHYVEFKGDLDSMVVAGTHDLALELGIPKAGPVVLTYHHEMDGPTAKCLLRYSRKGEMHLEARSNIKIATGRIIDLSAELELKSPHQNWDGKALAASFKHERRSQNYIASLSAQNSPSKPYSLKMEYNTEPRGSIKKILTKATVTTPIAKYRSQAAQAEFEISNSLFKMNAELSSEQNQLFRTEVMMQGTLKKGSGNIKLIAPFDKVKSIKAGLEVDSSSGYTAQSFLEVNDDRMLEWDSKVEYKGRSSVEGTVTLRSAIGPKYDVNVHVLSENAKKNLEFDMKMNDNDFLATTFLLETQGKNVNSQLVLKNRDKTWTLDAKKENTGTQSNVYSLSSRGISKPVELTLTWNEEGNDISPKITVCYDSDCLTGEAYYKETSSPGHFSSQMGLKGYHRPGEEVSVDFSVNSDPDLFQSKFLVDVWGKKFGYDGKLESGSKDEAKLVVMLPSRELHYLINYKDESDTGIKIHMEFLPDALRQPSKKLSADISHKSTSRQGGLDTHSVIIISHPDLSQPIKADVVANFHDNRAEKPVELKAEIEYSPDPRKKLFGEMHVDKQDSNTTVFFDFHAEDQQALALSFQAHAGSDRDRGTIGGKWKIVIPNRIWKGMNLLEFNAKEDKIHYYYRSPISQWESHTSWEHHAGKDCVIDSRLIKGGEESSVKLTLDTLEPCGELTVHVKSASPTSRFHLCLDTKDKKVLSLIAESFEGDEKMTDAKIAFNRTGEKSFSAHIHWKPEKLGNIVHNLMSMGDKIDYAGYLEQDIMKVTESMRRAASEIQGSILSPLANHVVEETSLITQEVSTDVKHIRNVAAKIYNRLPDFSETLAPMFRILGNVAHDLKELVHDLTPKAVEDFVVSLVESVKESTKSICAYGSVCYNLRYAYERKGLEGVGEYIYGVIENMSEAHYKIAIATKDFILENLSLPSISWEPLERTLRSMSRWTREKLDDLMESKAAQVVKAKLAEYADQLKEGWKEGSQAIKEDIEVQLQKLAEIKEIKFVLDMLKEILEEMQSEVKNLKLRKAAEDLEAFLSEFMKKGALSNALRVGTFDPENGKIDLEIKLLKSPEEIKRLLKASNPFSDEYSEVEEVKKSAGPVDAVTYAQAALKQEWLPPFKAHAQLVGGQHYVTFDSTFYDFAGKCSYLLARDFADGNFSVVVKYEGQGNKGSGSIDKSIIVVASDKVIEIKPDDETVQVDEQDVELPYTYGPVTVLRRGETVVVEYKKGVSVTCHLVHDYCTTAIGGWYYGKTAGLFGTYDHEPSNDFLRPKGQQAQNPVNFARSWEVSSGCRFKSLAQEIDVNPRDSRFDICRNAFKDSSSPLQPCFQELKEEEYLKICMRQVAIQRSASEAMCTVAAAFAHICKQKHFPVSLPSQCLKCQPKSGEALEYGSRRRLQPDQVIQSADVVFVVEERQCNSAVIKELDSISRLIDHALLDSRLTQNRFGLVAFGGRGREVPAHSHTARGKIFFDQKDLVLATARMNLKKDDFASDRQDSDTFQALTEAIRYPFRVGASKTLVLVTCSRCNEDAMSVSYPDIQTLLLERGIVLHTLSERTISVRKSSTKSKSIYGMDAQKVYTSKDRKLEGDPDLRAQVSYPKDVCLALAQEVGGSFFTTQPVKHGSSNEAKNWKSQLGKRLALSAQPHPCQQCDCTAAEDDVPVAVCAPCRAIKPARTLYNDVSDEDDDY